MLIRTFIKDDLYICNSGLTILLPHLFKIYPFTFDACAMLCVGLTLKCLLAKVEEHNPHISSIVFVYNSSYAEQIRTSEQNMYFWFTVPE